MAKHTSIIIQAHPNIYTNHSRSFRVDYAVPESGITRHTGLLLLVPGYLGHIDANVYKKMRRQFADTYNLVVVQCHYFGHEFMQKPSEYTIAHGRAVLHETIDAFNDMGWMQAIDLITCVTFIQQLLQLKSKRVIGYGHSHGAFLLYVANRLYPIFTYIIDNCARIRTDYFQHPRLEDATWFYFRAKEFVAYPELLDLSILLNKRQYTQVLTLQGDADAYVDHVEKEAVLQVFPRLQFELITAKDVDGVRFKSNTHGLDADFLQVFAYAMAQEQDVLLESYEKQIIFGAVTIDIVNSHHVPLFLFKNISL